MFARQEAPYEPAFRADQDRDEIEDAREQNDRGAGRHVGVIGKQQTCEACGEGNEDCDENQPDTSSAQKRAVTAGSSMIPTAISVLSA